MDVRLHAAEHYDRGYDALEAASGAPGCDTAQHHALTACAQALLGILKLQMDRDR